MPLIAAKAVPIKNPICRPVFRVIMEAIHADNAVPITTVAAGRVASARWGEKPGNNATAGAVTMNRPRPVPKSIWQVLRTLTLLISRIVLDNAELFKINAPPGRAGTFVLTDGQLIRKRCGRGSCWAVYSLLGEIFGLSFKTTSFYMCSAPNII